MDRVRLLALGLVLATLTAGCGGGGSSFDSGPIAPNNGSNKVSQGPDNGTLALFLTDGLNENYDHVWVSIKKVELKLAAGGLRTVFEDERGLGVDLKSLRDESGPRYRFLNALNLDAGTYVAAQITVDKNAVLFPAKSVRGQQTEFADPTLTVAYDPPKLLGTGHEDLVLDFDLSQWKVENGKLTAIVKPGPATGVESSERSFATVHRGTIDKISGDLPDRSFTLKSGKAEGIPVRTSTTTALVAAQPNGLAHGQTVQVIGVYDANTRRVDATSLEIEDLKALPVHLAEGSVADLDPKEGTWKFSPSQTAGFLPGMSTVGVGVSDQTKFFGSSGLALTKELFFKALSENADASVLVEGAYAADKNAFAASEARIADPADQPEVRVSGVIANPQKEDQTFAVTVSRFEGLMTAAGATASVAIVPTTKFVDADGKQLTQEQFFGSLAAPQQADVQGVLDSSTRRVLATTIKVSPAPASAKQAPKPKATAKKS